MSSAGNEPTNEEMKSKPQQKEEGEEKRKKEEEETTAVEVEKKEEGETKKEEKKEEKKKEQQKEKEGEAEKEGEEEVFSPQDGKKAKGGEGEKKKDGEGGEKKKPKIEAKAYTEGVDDWHQMTVKECVASLKLDAEFWDDGLTPQAVLKSREEHGSNLIPVPPGRHWIQILLENFCNVITAILLIIIGVSAWLQDWGELGVTLFVIILNTGLGFYQELGAENSAQALKEMTNGTARIRRNDEVRVMDINEVVVGDIVLLQQGDTVPADLRMFEVHNLQTKEDMLTGEPEPIGKITGPIERKKGYEYPLGDRKNIAFRMSKVLSGSGVGLVVAAGGKTQLGEISASLTEEKDERTELQIQLNYLMYTLFAICAVLVIVVFAANSFAGEGPVILYACAIGIAILPECLLVVVTIANTVSMSTMFDLAVIVKKLTALEVLSSVTDICSDKTGTLTTNVMRCAYFQIGIKKMVKVESPPRMSAAKMWVGGTAEQVEFSAHAEMETNKCFFHFMRAAALNSSTTLKRNEETGELTGDGNPSEVAIQTLGFQCSLSQQNLVDDMDYLDRGVFPFDSTTKMMTVGYYRKKDDPNAASASSTSSASSGGGGGGMKRMTTEDLEASGGGLTLQITAPSPSSKRSSSPTGKQLALQKEDESYVFVKGAPERVIKKCTMTMMPDGSLVKFTEELQNVVHDSIAKLAKKGLRCIAVAEREPNAFDLTSVDIQTLPRESLESNLVFLGLCGIYDPPRKESLPAVQTCLGAGIVVRMLTGDHPSTAATISEQVGIIGSDTSDDRITTGPEFDKKYKALTDEEMKSEIKLDEMPLTVGRCSPQTKVTMVRALQSQGRVVAMTGDGVNDAPSIRLAQVGCCMGSGADSTKDVADLIITNDNFSSIVAAVSEGRRIRAAISKFILHLLSGNVAEVIVLIIGLAIQINERSVFVISPVQILWLNVFTGTPPATGLSMDAATPELLKRPPSYGSILNAELIIDLVVMGLTLGGCSLGAFLLVYLGLYDGAEPLATNCNVHAAADFATSHCESVWRARTTAFIVLYLGLSLHAYNVRDSRLSIFKMKWFDNPWLAGSIIFNVVALFFIIYIPAIATSVFQHAVLDSPGSEWGIAFAMLAVFMVIVEVYKCIKNAVAPIKFAEIEAAPTLVHQDTIVMSDFKDENLEFIKSHYMHTIGHSFNFSEINKKLRSDTAQTWDGMSRTGSLQTGFDHARRHKEGEQGVSGYLGEQSSSASASFASASSAAAGGGEK